MKSVTERLAEELHVRLPQVEAAVALLDDKATVPFIARYRKEATGGLDDTQLRTLEERLTYLRELEERRAAILKSIEEQGKLTPELAARDPRRPRPRRGSKISICPIKPKRRTQGADRARSGPRTAGAGAAAGPDARAGARRPRPFVDADEGRRRRGGGARRRALDPDRARSPRIPSWSAACASCCGNRGEWNRRSCRARKRTGAKFSDYFDASEPVKQIPSHRALALLRGRKEGVLRLARDAAGRADGAPGRPNPERRIAGACRDHEPGPRRRRVAGRNRALDLEGQAPRRTSNTRSSSGCASRPKRKRSASSAATCTTCCWPRRPASASRWGSTRASAPASRSRSSTAPASCWRPRRSTRTSRARTGTARCARSPRCARRHGVQLIAIGNGTASRETDKLAADLMARNPEPAADPHRRLRSGRLGVFGVGAGRAASSPISTCRCAARSRSRGGSRIRSPSWCASIRRRSASANTSTTSASRCWRGSSTPSSRTA